jgi:dolichyl-phosphate beta-glucosyltransferase
LGRAFATAASLVLRVPVYDTQCGAKLFRRSAMLSHALEEPFLSRWLFDVELLSRLLVGAPGIPQVPIERIHEEPLQKWSDREGSKLRAREMLRSLVDLGRIEIAAEKRRRAANRA